MAMSAYSYPDHEKDCCTGGDDCVALVPYIAPPKRKSPLLYFPLQPSLSCHRSECEEDNPPLVNDIIQHILQYCDAPTLSRFSSTCSTFRSMAYEDDLWNRLCQTKFGVLADELRPKPNPVRMLYVLQVRRMRDVFRRDFGSGMRVQRVSGDVLRAVLHSSV